MNDFKEWLSDYLRYFLLLLAGILTYFLIVIGVRVYKAVTSPVMEDPTVVLTETDQIVQTELVTETAIDTDRESDTGSESTADANDKTSSSTEKVSESVTEPSLNIKQETAVRDVKCEVHETVPETVETDLLAETEAQTEAQTEVQTEPQTEPQTETEYVPVYKTLKGSCYIRSGPSMEADIIGEYMYGTTVEFLEDVGGWFKVRIDGMTGYMGARFF